MKHCKFSVLLAGVMLFSASCGNSASKPVESSGQSETSTSAAETTPEYVYPDADYEGHEFVILNQDQCNWANRLIVPEESTGDLINDAMYDRNSRIADRYNIKIVEQAVSKDEIPTLMKNAVNAGDDAYDVVMFPVDVIGSPMVDGYFTELGGVKSLNLDEAWWDSAVINAATLNGKCYIASSDISFFPFEATWVVYFNEDRFDELSADYPYQLVRDGKWTIDKLTELTKLGASLNGQETFAYKENGTANYGLITHSQIVDAMIFGAGETMLKTEKGTPVFAGDSERSYLIYDKIAAFTKTEGAFLDRDQAGLSDADKSPSLAFKNGRFMFFAETLGHISNLRDFNGDFGVLPIPKLDESQDGYHSMMATWGTLMTTIPASASDPERTGVILDALAYDSYKNLMEPYYDTYLSQKGARNEDSAEMLKIVRDTRIISIGKMFGWTNDVISSITSKVMNGESDVASSIASSVQAVKAAIDKTLEAMK